MSHHEKELKTFQITNDKTGLKDLSFLARIANRIHKKIHAQNRKKGDNVTVTFIFCAEMNTTRMKIKAKPCDKL